MICVIKCEDINLEQKTKLEILTTKTRAGTRVIHLPNKLVELISNFRQESNLFLLTDTKKLEPRNLLKVYKKYLKEL